ncbi:MAG: hypothetical protein MUO53_11755 [Maribacter sp.]|nr:hypothetical protein [Maribacter sp.]
MGQDLRKLFEKEREDKKFHLKEGHEARFLARLEKDLQKTPKRRIPFYEMAASVAILVGLGWYTYTHYKIQDPLKTTVIKSKDTTPTGLDISLGDLSPDLRKVENYYVANINLELSKLEVSDENKNMVEGFMDRLADLDTEYKRLNVELNQIGPNDQTIGALIKNLQLRLQLLHKLKEKLNELKSSKNEEIETNTI